ncbi:TerB family tellurite resistance protein [Falsiruegeria mediterranea]|uniref:Co-chaperone DjlA N-terminal domain-containing protein n=1 Tax=Falsiruegeria mediterranea M17 TaxID=1200281 RepID=A0A2R8C763_9RHOB|nr:TerB family tellurite resistance protein [Falsiruegeria mediterranea]SPJ28245.1 hypothetical protein TRM7615_01742 [Falsiruegeria mediterranea M17]
MSFIESQIENFDDVECVVANSEKFKARIGAGAGAFSSLKVADLLGELWNVGSAARDGAAIAGSGVVATTFFPASGLATFFGLGAAATPIGWVVGAGAAAGGLFYGVNRLFRTYYGSRVDEIPRFLNTPIDVLGASFMDLVGSLAVKVASIDGHIHERERLVIADYFVEEWGFDPIYTSIALDLLEETTEEQRIIDMAATLAEFARTNPDCDFSKIQKGLSALLTEIAEADGKLDEREEMAIERIVAALDQENSTYSAIKRAANVPIASITSATVWVRGKLGGGNN